MNAFDILSADDLDSIARQIGDGAAAVDSWTTRTAGGWNVADGAREYFCHLMASSTTPRRVARVTAYRQADGSWSISDLDVFNMAAGLETIQGDDDGREFDILAAIDSDSRRIVRDEVRA
jgi:hypothetical protein